MEEIIDEINSINTSKNLYKIKLTGYRNFEINIDLKTIKSDIIKIKDFTKLKYQIKENKNTIMGNYVKILNHKLENNEINQDEYDDILEVMLSSLKK